MLSSPGAPCRGRRRMASARGTRGDRSSPPIRVRVHPRFRGAEAAEPSNEVATANERPKTPKITENKKAILIDRKRVKTPVNAVFPSNEPRSGRGSQVQILPLRSKAAQGSTTWIACEAQKHDRGGVPVWRGAAAGMTASGVAVVAVDRGYRLHS
jgi:hypothetical protein